MSVNLKKSNAAHKRLAEHYLDISSKPKSKEEAFEGYVKHNYHYEVKAIQKKECRVLSKKERTLVWRNTLKTCVAYNKRDKHYVPPKYR